MSRRRITSVSASGITLLLIGMAPGGSVAAGEASPAACAASVPGADELKAKAALERDPESVSTRVKLANALSDRGCYADSIKILEVGVERDPHNRILQERLRSARSTLSEQGYFEGLGHAEEAAKIQRYTLRCRQLADVAACDQALAASPGDRSLLVAKADALARANRPADALPLYEKVSSLDPADDTLKGKISAAETARQALVARCQSEGGDVGIAACDAGLLRGAGDQFSIYKRKGMLLQAQDQPSRALDAYIAANLIDPSDRSVALAIVALTDSTQRQDELALAARGSALLTLGRTAAPTATAAMAAATGGAAATAASAAAARPRQKAAPQAPMTARVESAPPPAYSNAALAGDSH